MKPCKMSVEKDAVRATAKTMVAALARAIIT